MTCDVAIIGAGLAGLTLARHLLLTTDVRVVVLDKRSQLPPIKQKVGEATVQLSAYYLSKVLDLEEHLLRDHFMKYNLRFYWKTPGKRNERFEDYSQTYIRGLSNIASYQLDRNKLEAELLRLNLADRRFALIAPVSDLDVDVCDDGPHEITFGAGAACDKLRATWVIDASGRSRVLARRLNLSLGSPIHHGSSFLWVDGLLNIEKMTDLPPVERLRACVRRQIGHFPVWLATNHFMGEGYWVWVIPLHGRTSVGVVYDNRLLSADHVSTAPKLVKWLSHEFPLFAGDLPLRQVVDRGSFREFSYDCQRTISPSRWALTGEAGRFTDPLYSPGGDLIAIHNTLIVDAIQSNAVELPGVCARHERIMRAMYEAYVPAYATSYEALGDQQVMTLKYTWELAVYFAMYVFPFINGLLTDEGFTSRFLPLFGRLGRVNADLQVRLRESYMSRKRQQEVFREPVFHELMSDPHLRAAETTFYQIGLSADQALRIVRDQVVNLEHLAKEITGRLSAHPLPVSSSTRVEPFQEARP